MDDTESSADYKNNALDEFRVNWQRELQVQNESVQQDDDVEQTPGLHDIEAQAKAESFYRTAVDLEQRGKVYDALAFYRKATQIVPDIEFKFYEQQKLNYDANKKYHNLPNDFSKQLDLSTSDAKEDIQLIDGLYEKFQRDLCCEEVYAGKMLINSRDNSVIATGHNMHISELPPEIMMNILRWVVSSQLDMVSLEQFSAVCKGCYIYGRDEELWRLACVKVWGHNLGALDGMEEGLSYSSWRDMFIRRERVLFSGCYISKTTYLRMGENSFQDQFYRPLQLVEYYRYIRFLPDGKVLMMTSADEPAQGVNRLKQLYASRPDVLRGRYRLFGNIVTLILQKSQSQRPTLQRQRRGSLMPGDEEANNSQYVIELRIMNTPKRQFAQLAWTKYTLVQRRNKIETSSEFDLTVAKYPPLWFSPVKSYHLDADAPLT
ncbi:hypothetical protein ACLKA7_011396 [Drosophila subpalustris]